MLQTHKIISDPFSTHMTSGRTLPWGPLFGVCFGASARIKRTYFVSAFQLCFPI